MSPAVPAVCNSLSESLVAHFPRFHAAAASRRRGSVTAARSAACCLSQSWNICPATPPCTCAYDASHIGRTLAGRSSLSVHGRPIRGWCSESSVVWNVNDLFRTGLCQGSALASVLFLTCFHRCSGQGRPWNGESIRWSSQPKAGKAVVLASRVAVRSTKCNFWT